jgi:hypothetical protein
VLSIPSLRRAGSVTGELKCCLLLFLPLCQDPLYNQELYGMMLTEGGHGFRLSVLGYNGVVFFF